MEEGAWMDMLEDNQRRQEGQLAAIQASLQSMTEQLRALASTMNRQFEAIQSSLGRREVVELDSTMEGDRTLNFHHGNSHIILPYIMKLELSKFGGVDSENSIFMVEQLENTWTSNSNKDHINIVNFEPADTAAEKKKLGTRKVFDEMPVPLGATAPDEGVKVDGFGLDLASMMKGNSIIWDTILVYEKPIGGKATGTTLCNPLIVAHNNNDPIFHGMKIIDVAWDPGGLYQVATRILEQSEESLQFQSSRLWLSLVSSTMPDKCWLGICLLAVTCEECSSEHFAASYALGFQKLLSTIQPPSSTRLVKVASCASLTDLFTRLAEFPTLKKDATSLAGRLALPILQLLNGNEPEAVWEGSINLLCTLITLFPSSTHCHYDSIEAVLVSRIMSSQRNGNMSKKLANCLAMLPKVRGDQDSWSLLMQKILIATNVLLMDGSLQGSLLPLTTAMHQELLCAEIPALHLDSLDLLMAVIKGVRSQLLPHAANVVRLLTEYFRRATLPSIRIKVYSIMQILLISMGAGMALYLAQEVISNASADLNVSPGSDANLSTKATLRTSHRKRKHISASPMEQPNGADDRLQPHSRIVPTSLSVKIAALKALEALLTVGGSLRSETWRSDVDYFMINVATNACDEGWGIEGKCLGLMDSPASLADFQLAALEALLASLLSPFHVRPPYLSQGLELFRRGKQETGTKVAAFCVHAVLALEVLIHPRSLPLMGDPTGKSYSIDEGLKHGHQKLNISSFSKEDTAFINDHEYDNDFVEAALDGANINKHVENAEQLLKGSFEETAGEGDVVKPVEKRMKMRKWWRSDLLSGAIMVDFVDFVVEFMFAKHDGTQKWYMGEGCSEDCIRY